MPLPIEFTGERFIPGVAGEIEFEHVHRYAFACRHVAGKRVLDAACGEGYGSALLARTAATVAGVDIDGATLAHAAARYASVPNVAFHQASVATLPFADASFDLIASFETIEHLEAADQPRMLAEFARVLAPRGLLILSAPNRVEYSDKRGYANPFHRHEHDRAELDGLLVTHFSARRYYHQRVWLGSTLWRERGADAYAAWEGDSADVAEVGVPPAMYYVVVAARADADLPNDPLGLSLFSDREHELHRLQAQGSEIIRLDALLGERTAMLDKQTAHVTHLENLVAFRDKLIVERDAQLESHGLRMLQFERQEKAHAVRAAAAEQESSVARAELARLRDDHAVAHEAHAAVNGERATLRAELDAARAAIAAQERIIDYRQSLRGWAMLPWQRLRAIRQRNRTE
ncbi:MAG TPA: class I SAM-dependent methyltransferase [Casimicrobiaceae bacterium]